MGMHIGQNIQPGLAADPPQISKVGPIKDDNARVKAVRVQVIVVDYLGNPAFLTLAPAEQECATFAAFHPTPFQFRQPCSPKCSGAADVVVRRYEVPYSRSN